MTHLWPLTLSRNMNLNSNDTIYLALTPSGNMSFSIIDTICLAPNTLYKYVLKQQRHHICDPNIILKVWASTLLTPYLWNITPSGSMCLNGNDTIYLALAPSGSMCLNGNDTIYLALTPSGSMSFNQNILIVFTTVQPLFNTKELSFNIVIKYTTIYFKHPNHVTTNYVQPCLPFHIQKVTA